MKHDTSSTTAVIIIDHGSRNHAANNMLNDIVAAMQQRHPQWRLYPAHMELAEPTLAQQFDRAVADGATHIVVFPFFLSPGRHSRDDIPRMADAAAAAHPHITCTVTEPFGHDERLLDIIATRINDATGT